MSVLDRLRNAVTPGWRGDSDTLYELISNSRRRAVVTLLADGRRTMDELSTEIARQECGSPVKSSERKRVYIALYQVHLDKLLDAAVIREGGRDEYRPGPNHGAALSAIEAVDEVVA